MSLPIVVQIPQMLPEDVARVTALETEAREMLQVDITTHHLIHAGQYHRTIMIPAGVMITGAMIKRATTITISGHVSVYLGQNRSEEIAGYRVLPASAGRKQAFLAIQDTHITMSFPTSAKTVEDAEREFTDETDKLMSHSRDNHVVITGE